MQSASVSPPPHPPACLCPCNRKEDDWNDPSGHTRTFDKQCVAVCPARRDWCFPLGEERLNRVTAKEQPLPDQLI